MRGEDDSGKLSCIVSSWLLCVPFTVCIRSVDLYCLGRCDGLLAKGSKNCPRGIGRSVQYPSVVRVILQKAVSILVLRQYGNNLCYRCYLFVGGSGVDHHISGLVQRQQQSNWSYSYTVKKVLLLWSVLSKPTAKKMVSVKCSC